MNPDIHSALFSTTPSWSNKASRRFGVAWWGGIVGTGTCSCCGITAPVHKGYNGGAHMSARFCTPCTAQGHGGCEK